MPRPTPALGRSVGFRAMAVVLLCAMCCAMLCAVACESPTLPLPPPESPMQTEGTDAAHIKLTAMCGGAENGAEIVIINETLVVTAPDQAVGGSFANGCGAWDAEVLAQSGDTLSITQQVGTVSSGPTAYVVR